MKIYPKIRKYQSGGQLSEVNFYPTAQYTPTSNVAITQGAWTPLKQTVTPDATIDPELLKKGKGNTNEVRLTMAEMNNDLHKFNSLNEAEKRSNLGVNLLNNIKGNTAKVVQLENLQNTTNTAIKKADSSDALGVLAVDREGNVAVTMPDGKVNYVTPADYISNLGKFRGNTVKELVTKRTEDDSEAFDKLVSDKEIDFTISGPDAYWSKQQIKDSYKTPTGSFNKDAFLSDYDTLSKKYEAFQFKRFGETLLNEFPEIVEYQDGGVLLDPTTSKASSISAAEYNRSMQKAKGD